jgi:hypothetical protein
MAALFSEMIGVGFMIHHNRNVVIGFQQNYFATGSAFLMSEAGDNQSAVTETPQIHQRWVSDCATVTHWKISDPGRIFRNRSQTYTGEVQLVQVTTDTFIKGKPKMQLWVAAAPREGAISPILVGARGLDRRSIWGSARAGRGGTAEDAGDARAKEIILSWQAR